MSPSCNRKSLKGSKRTTQMLDYYPNISSSSVALYCEGISIKAARANSASFLERSIFFDIISVKFTNYRRHKNTPFLN